MPETGVAADSPGGRLDATLLAQLVGQAAAASRLPVPGVDPERAPVVLAFGHQLDARPVRSGRRTDDPNSPLTPEQVAGYLAKYATKSVTDSGAADTAHHRRIRATCREFAGCTRAAWAPGEQDNPYALLGHWCTCSASAATSPPSPAATRSPSAGCAGPAAAPKP
jgi:hypothetical protein